MLSSDNFYIILSIRTIALSNEYKILLMGAIKMIEFFSDLKSELDD